MVADLSAKLTSMYLQRKTQVEEVENSAQGGRRRSTIMQDNPFSCGARSVAVLQRLRDGVASDVDFQRVRLQRLKNASAPEGATSGRSSGARDPNLPYSLAAMPQTTARLPPALVTHPLTPAPPTSEPRPSSAPLCIPARPPTTQPPLSPRVSDRPTAPSRRELPPPPPSLCAPSSPRQLLSAATSSSGVVGAAEPQWSSANLPHVMSCKELNELWHRGRRDAAGVITYHPLSLLCNTVDREKLFPGRLTQCQATRATRYKRVAAEIADLGGIDEFEKQWGDRIVGNVYTALAKGHSKGGKRGRMS